LFALARELVNELWKRKKEVWNVGGCKFLEIVGGEVSVRVE